MVLVQKFRLFQLFLFMQYRPEKCFLRYSRGKNAFLGYKNKNVKKSKNWHFCKVVNPWFWSKNGHCSIFFFLGNEGQENVFYDILERKNAFLGYKNKKFKRSKNWHVFKGVNLWFLSKYGHFSNFSFLGNIFQENVFYNILEQKNVFLGYKKKKFIKPKNWHFSKGVKHGFGPKIGIVSTFFFLAIKARKMSFTIF